MNRNAAQENIRTLAAAIGQDEHVAAQLLDKSIIISFDIQDQTGKQLATFLELLLTRTITQVITNPAEPVRGALEIVINSARPITECTKLWIDISSKWITISDRPLKTESITSVHSVLLLLGACYTAARAIKAIVGEGLPPHSDPLIIDFEQLFEKDFIFEKGIVLDNTYLAGAGAVGNGFLLALSQFDVSGELSIADPDFVDEGNLNRCVWFSEVDKGANKAERLAQLAQPHFPKLKLIPYASELQKVPARSSGAWLKRLIIGVDSRRVRRNLQNEIPGEVYDASTTDIREIVLHFNRQPLNGLACLSCIYFQDVNESAHEQHVADVLGVSVQEVQMNFVSNEAAKKICSRYSDYSPESIRGLAYDSLFKQLCGEGVLQTAEDRQVLAPFSFVSVLAGTYLAIELVRRLQNNDAIMGFNYWKASPWSNPVVQLRRIRSSRAECEFCGNLTLIRVAESIWSRNN